MGFMKWLLGKQEPHATVKQACEQDETRRQRVDEAEEQALRRKRELEDLQSEARYEHWHWPTTDRRQIDRRRH